MGATPSQWSRVLSVEYVVIVIRAGSDGERGFMALASMVSVALRKHRTGIAVIVLGVSSVVQTPEVLQSIEPIHAAAILHRRTALPWWRARNGISEDLCVSGGDRIHVSDVGGVKVDVLDDFRVVHESRRPFT
jgi:hypothetical protein